VTDDVAITGPENSVVLDKRNVAALRGRRYSPSKTAGVVVGATVGTLVLAGAATVLAISSSGGFGGGFVGTF
jgi:hypothetical protein